VLGTTGCGLVVNGIHQDIAVTSTPGGARVSVDGIQQGTTPVVVPVKRKHAHVVKVEIDGYQPYEESVVPVQSSWEWGNLIFGWLPGFAIDAWTGGMFEFADATVHATFRPPDTIVKTAQSGK
jgi:PEGA domain-containing protein